MEQTAGTLALEYAGFWRRFAAFFIDVIILSMIIRILFPFQGFNFWNIQTAWYFVPLIAISNVVSTAVTVAYSIVFWTWRGQTLGMIVLNIKVLRDDGSNITIGYALLRYLGYIVCFLMLGTGFLWIAFDSRKQGIHDKIADTVVVKLPEPTRTQTALANPRPSAG
ncbi:MAG: RDD family protein [Acidobacteriia bacterium]|nr:RDD family protein [Terriglobia bacterium]